MCTGTHVHMSHKQTFRLSWKVNEWPGKARDTTRATRRLFKWNTNRTLHSVADAPAPAPASGALAISPRTHAARQPRIQRIRNPLTNTSQLSAPPLLPAFVAAAATQSASRLLADGSPA